MLVLDLYDNQDGFVRDGLIEELLERACGQGYEIVIDRWRTIVLARGHE